MMQKPPARPASQASAIPRAPGWLAFTLAHLRRRPPEPAALTQRIVATHASGFFITGVMRSGTTVLQRVVAHSLDTDYIRTESALRIPVESFEVLEKHQSYPMIGREAFVTQYQRFLAGLWMAMHSTISGEVLVLKDPLALKSLMSFHALMPETKFIITIRNPLATAASIYRVRNRQRQQGKNSFITPMDFGDIVEYIAKLCEVIISLRAKENVCIVKYEELVGRDPTLLLRLGQFIGAPVKLDIPDDSAAYDPVHAFWTEESGKELCPNSLDKFQTELTGEEIMLVKSRLASFCALFGYA